MASPEPPQGPAGSPEPSSPTARPHSAEDAAEQARSRAKLGVLVLLVGLVLVVAAVLLATGRGSAPGPEATQSAAPDQSAAPAQSSPAQATPFPAVPPGSAAVPAVLQGAVVVVGKPAGLTVDAYEDFLCPICRQFEATASTELGQAVAAGRAQVRYHPVAILNRASRPTGYSTRAANAALCAAQAGGWISYHRALFAQQPAENSAGLTDQQLIDMGQRAGVGGDFAQCVRSARNVKTVADATAAATRDPALRQDGGFGTPTVLVNGKQVDWSDGPLLPPGR